MEQDRAGVVRGASEIDGPKPLCLRFERVILCERLVQRREFRFDVHPVVGEQRYHEDVFVVQFTHGFVGEIALDVEGVEGSQPLDERNQGGVGIVVLIGSIE